MPHVKTLYYIFPTDVEFVLFPVHFKALPMQSQSRELLFNSSRMRLFGCDGK